MKYLSLIILLFGLTFKISCENESVPVPEEISNPNHPRYGDGLRNLPSWEWKMIEEGKTNKEIEDEWDRRYKRKR
jgi:hypothetical protein